MGQNRGKQRFSGFIIEHWAAFPFRTPHIRRIIQSHQNFPKHNLPTSKYPPEKMTCKLFIAAFSFAVSSISSEKSVQKSLHQGIVFSIPVQCTHCRYQYQAKKMSEEVRTPQSTKPVLQFPDGISTDSVTFQF